MGKWYFTVFHRKYWIQMDKLFRFYGEVSIFYRFRPIFCGIYSTKPPAFRCSLEKSRCLGVRNTGRTPPPDPVVRKPDLSVVIVRSERRQGRCRRSNDGQGLEERLLAREAFAAGFASNAWQWQGPSRRFFRKNFLSAQNRDGTSDR